MKTISEIKSMNLLDRQKLVVDLRANVPVKDKYFPIALQLINTANSMKDWAEPETLEVKNTSGRDVTVDKTTIAADATGKLYPWQYIAVARFFEAVDTGAHNDAIKLHVRKPGKAEETPAALTPDQVKAIIPDIVAAVLKAMGAAPKAAATALLLFCILFMGDSARAQQQGYAVGSTPSLYHSYSVAGLNGGTNAWSGTQSFTNVAILTSNVVTNANWTIGPQGTPTNNVTYTTNVTYYTPGLISLANYDSAQIFWGFSQMGAAIGPTATSSWDYSPDGTNWQLNALSILCATNAVNLSGTNYMFPPDQAPGYLRLNNITDTGSGFMTNVVVQVSLKPYRNGP